MEKPLVDRLRAMAAIPGMGMIGAGLSAYQEREVQRLLLEAAERLGHDAGLIREALSALKEMLEWFEPPMGCGQGLYDGERAALMQAHAAAEKLRGALNGGAVGARSDASAPTAAGPAVSPR
jgi:hypothetical protein